MIRTVLALCYIGLVLTCRSKLHRVVAVVAILTSAVLVEVIGC